MEKGLFVNIVIATTRLRLNKPDTSMFVNYRSRVGENDSFKVGAGPTGCSVLPLFSRRLQMTTLLLPSD